MCGIAGYWNLGGEPAHEETLKRMLLRIRHRGPDDEGVWREGPVGLGHCRLSILDLSPRGHQPFLTADGQGVLTYSGEVYNFRELRAELECEGVRFMSATDTEVVLYALHRWGPEKAIPRFNGMFAFAYFDRRDSTLWLSRDRLGIKPLYVTQSGGRIVFGSEIKALLAHPDVPCLADMHVLSAHILNQRLEGEWTPFENIEALRPGSILKVSGRSAQEIIYFDILRDLDIDRLIEAAVRDPKQLLSEFETIFSESVKIHMVSDAPLAVMTSGGVDSSLVTAVAKGLKPDIVGYVADVKGAVISEGEKAHIVGRHLGVPIRQIDVDQEETLRLWPVTIWHNDLPTTHAQDMPMLMVARACRRDGVKVLLTGEGSDELFGGYPWQRGSYDTWRLRRLQARLIPNTALFRKVGRFWSQLNPLDLKLLAKSPFAHIAELEDADKILRHSCVVDGGQRLKRHEALFKKLERLPLLEDRAFLARCLDDLRSYLPILLSRNDKMGMAASIETRVPFIENQLIALAMRLPRRAKYHKGISKWIVKSFAEKRLPREIVHATKMGFAVAEAPWQRAAAHLLREGMVPDLLKWETQARPLLLERVVKEPGVAMSLVGVELWARIFLKGESPEALGELLAHAVQAGAKAARVSLTQPSPTSSLSVVIPTYNRAESLKDTLLGLKKQNFNGDRSYFEVIVVDNNSSDHTKRVVEEMQKEFGGPLHYSFEPRQGISYARNSGIRQAKGEVVAFLDDDVIPEPDWLPSLRNCFREEGADMIGGKVELLWLSEKPSWLSKRLMTPLVFSDYGEKRFQVKDQRTRFVGANFACRRSLFDSIGFFREELGRRGKSLIGGEDFEWFDRLRNVQARIFYEPGSKVRHKVWGEKVTEDYLLRWFLDIGRTHGHLMDWRWHHGLTVLPLWCWKEATAAFLRYGFIGRFAEDKTRHLEAKTQSLFYRGILEERATHWQSKLFKKALSCHFVRLT